MMRSSKLLPSVATLVLLSACAGHQPTTEAQLGGTPGIHLAQAAEESGDFELAANVYASAAESAPRDASIQLRYADALLKMGKVTEARDVLLKHMNTVSNPRELHGGLGLIYIVQGQPAQALAEFDAMGDKEGRWMVNRAIALDMLGRHTEAQPLYRKALLANPNNTAVTSNLVLSLLLSGNKAEAIELAAGLANDPSPKVRATYGVAQAAKGNLAAAREALPGVNDAQLMQLAKAVDNTGHP
jgi:Flp pilus assembly protein TadD